MAEKQSVNSEKDTSITNTYEEEVKSNIVKFNKSINNKSLYLNTYWKHTCESYVLLKLLKKKTIFILKICMILRQVK